MRSAKKLAPGDLALAHSCELQDTARAMSDVAQPAQTRSALAEPQLPLARYRLDFRAHDRIILRPFQGAVWRSAFGLALKNLSARAAETGEAAEAGLYTYFFETPPPPDATKMRRYDAAPHPYVIAAEPNFEQRTFEPGETLAIELTLIGRGNDAAPAIFAAFAAAAAGGLDKSRGRAILTDVHSIWRSPEPDRRLATLADGSLAPAAAESPAIPPMPDAVEVHLISPLRLTLDNKLVGPAQFRPGDLLRALLRRVSMLMSFHTGADLDTDFRALTDLANRARMAEPELKLAAQQRWSTNQAEVKMDGLMGGFLLDMRGLEPLWPYLWLGQWVHAGKGTVMGLGAIHVREALNI